MPPQFSTAMQTVMLACNMTSVSAQRSDQRPARRRISNHDKTSGVDVYPFCAAFHVRKGQNVLLIKTNQEDLGEVFEPWGLVTSIMPIERMWNFALTTQDGFLPSQTAAKDRAILFIYHLLDTPMMLDRSAPDYSFCDDSDRQIHIQESRRSRR